jgi:excisionase family DNA binding protein
LEYLTVDEIASDLRVARMTVYRMIHAGDFPAIRVGGRSFRVPTTAYAAYKATLHSEAEARQQRAAGLPAHIPGQLTVTE